MHSSVRSRQRWTEAVPFPMRRGARSPQARSPARHEELSPPSLIARRSRRCYLRLQRAAADADKIRALLLPVIAMLKRLLFGLFLLIAASGATGRDYTDIYFVASEPGSGYNVV